MASAVPTPTAEAQRLLDDFVRVDNAQWPRDGDARSDATTISLLVRDDNDDENDGSDRVVRGERGATSDKKAEKRKTAVKRWEGTLRPTWWFYRFGTPADDFLLACGLVCAVTSGVLVACTPRAVANILASQGDESSTAGEFRKLFWVACAVFVLDVVSTTALEVAAPRQMKYSASEAMRQAFFVKLPTCAPIRQTSQKADDNPSSIGLVQAAMGRHLAESVRAGAQIAAALGFVLSGGGKLFGLFVMLPFVYAMLFALLWYLASVCLAQCGLVYNPATPHHRREYAPDRRADAALVRIIPHIRDVMLLNASKAAGDTLKRLRGQAEVATNTDIVKAVAFGISVVLLLATLLVHTLQIDSAFILRGNYEPIDVLQTFLGILLMIIAAVRLVILMKAILQARQLYTSWFRVLEMPLRVDAVQPEGFSPERCEGAIKFTQVSYTEPCGLALTDFSLTIDKGATIVVVDTSPHASALTSLLLRVVPFESGEITLDGEDIEELGVHWLRQQIAVVEREPELYSEMTVHDNIAAGKDSITRAQVIAAAKTANMHDAIMTLPGQYDTMLGDVSEGVFSRDTRQLLTIARALARDPKILILDHVTHAANTTQKVVQVTLDDIVHTTAATTLELTHRVLLRHKDADKIVVMESGKIVESGTHDELIHRDGGRYKEMYRRSQHRGKKEMEVAEVVDETNVADMVSLGVSQSPARRITETQDWDIAPISLRDLLELVTPFKTVLCLGILVAVAGGVDVVWRLMSIADNASSLVRQYGVWLVTKNKDDLNLESSVGLLALLEIWTLLFMPLFTFAWMRTRLETHIRDMWARALLRQDIGYLDAKSSALVETLVQNTAAVAQVWGVVPACLLALGAAFVFASVTVFAADSESTLTLVAVGLTSIYFGVKSVDEPSTKTNGDTPTLDSTLNHKVGTVVALGLEETLADTYRARTYAQFDSLLTVRRLFYLVACCTKTSVFLLVSTAVISNGSARVARGELSREQFFRTLICLATLAVCAHIAAAIAVSYIAGIKATRAAGAQLVALQSFPVTIDPISDDGLRPQSAQGKIEFRDVTFHDPKATSGHGLVHFSATIEAGETVVFCGPPDGGQSSIAALLGRFYDPTDGVVLLDDLEVKQLNVAWLRNKIALVGSAPLLLEELTLAENITLGLTRAVTERAMKAASELANAHAFISEKFGGRYDEKVRWSIEDLFVGSKRVAIDTGLQECIALARAILRKPTVLVLDDVTSGLRTLGTASVDKGVSSVLAADTTKKRTTIIVGHSLSAARRADKIFVLDGGRVVAQGTHNELLLRSEVYGKLVAAAAPVAADA